MRLTCLKCGHQVEIATSQAELEGYTFCVCGVEHVYPSLQGPNTFPNERAAESSRKRAFRTAGITRNIGGLALGLSIVGIICFPIALIGSVVGLYVLKGIPETIRRYSGYKSAITATMLGLCVFIVEGAMIVDWYGGRQRLDVGLVQETAAEELRALFELEQSYRAAKMTYAPFSKLDFQPLYGHYTIYLAPDDFVSGQGPDGPIVTRLPLEFFPRVGPDQFRAVAVFNLDTDRELDVWVVDENGNISHERDDTALTH